MRASIRVLAFVIIAGAAASCGNVSRTGRSPAYLVVVSMQAAQGNKPTTLGGILTSDVITNVTSPAPCSTATPCPTVFNDIGQAVLSLSLKDAGSATVPSTPTPNNAITVDRIHIEYVRADGRNTPGVDVPWPWDAGVTVTVPTSGTATFTFELVRHAAKEEAPLVLLKTSATIITTLARVTFYGHDQAGNEVNVTGTIQVDFGNFGD